ncbi:hypothetical protein [Sphingomonas sp.]|uniref:hypothetical protein n=1 Tax=Sphingomonas sp. TaxID=28214 RepID=UPI0035BC3192
MKTVLLAGLALASFATAASAQELVQWAAPASVQQGRYSYFPVGTPLRLTTRTELNTKFSRPGDRFYLQVAEELTYRGQVVVPIGSVAVGEVARAERNGHFGKKGQLEVRLLYVQTPSGPVRLSGSSEHAGKGQGVLAIGGALVVAWPMFFIHGTSGRLQADSPITAYLADDLRFPVQTPAVQAAAIAVPDGQAGTVLAANGGR